MIWICAYLAVGLLLMLLRDTLDRAVRYPLSHAERIVGVLVWPIVLVVFGVMVAQITRESLRESR